jgi:UDP-N-acetylmuramyl pentapeptide phosphotransferase/UDP-N-acetylglucosamine-1-phosphate transferase
MWFVNLFNFMDGIDGISGVALIGMGGGAAAVMLAGGGTDSAFGAAIAVAGALLAAVAAGFLTQNWHPARVFLGDVGSIPLGYCAAALMLALAVQGAPVAALLLPAYHVFDATVTLGRRALRGEALTEAHRSHGYQRAVAGGLRHDQVCFRLMGLQLVLVGLALASPVAPLIALMLGYGATAALWWRLDRRGGMITAPRG